MDILKRYDSGENMCKLAKEYEVGCATLHDRKKKILEIGWEWDAEDNLPFADWLQSLSDRGFETSEEDLNSSFEGSKETEKMMTDEEI